MEKVRTGKDSKGPRTNWRGRWTTEKKNCKEEEASEESDRRECVREAENREIEREKR